MVISLTDCEEILDCILDKTIFLKFLNSFLMFGLNIQIEKTEKKNVC